jgi:hypothetical protein
VLACALGAESLRVRRARPALLARVQISIAQKGVVRAAIHGLSSGTQFTAQVCFMSAAGCGPFSPPSEPLSTLGMWRFFFFCVFGAAVPLVGLC